MADPQLDDLLHFERLVDGALSPAEQAAVETRIHDPVFREFYIEQMVLSAVLERQFAAGYDPASGTSLPASPPPHTSGVFPAASLDSREPTWWEQAKQIVVQPRGFSLLVAAVCTISFILTAAQIRTQRAVAPSARDAASAKSSPFAARLLRMEQAEWAAETPPLLDGYHLPVGQPLVLQSGFAELRCYDGASLVLEGPAELRLLTKNAVHLERGKLTAFVPEQAVGFSVSTPTAQVIDLGTEFGVRVDQGRMEVHVFFGRVELQPHDSQQASLLVETGSAVEWPATQAPRLTKAQPQQFRRQLTARHDERSEVNVALGKPIVAASGSWNFTGLGSPDHRYIPERVVDGATSDEVGTYWLGRDGRTEESFVVDLQQIYRLQRIELVNTRNFFNGDRATKDCELWIATELSQGELLSPQLLRATTLPNASDTSPSQLVHTLHFWTPDSQSPPLKARYLKFVAKNYYGVGTGLNELRVFPMPESDNKADSGGSPSQFNHDGAKQTKPLGQ